MREDHTAIYDPARDRMVVFGGAGRHYDYNDAWALLLVDPPAWTPLAPLGTPPNERHGHTAVYDPLRDRMVVFGGCTGSSVCYSTYNDTWALSLADPPAWTQLAPLGTPPSPRLGYTAVYDPLRDRMVVFGGAGLGDNVVWRLSLADPPAWTQLAPLGTPPSPRTGHTAFYDPLRDCMLVFGGASGGARLNDVWALSLADPPAWTRLAPSGGVPGDRANHSAIYDPARDRMVIFGGYRTDAWDDYNDTWALSLGGTPEWSDLAPLGLRPSPRYSHTAIYDPARDRMVMFGGAEDPVDHPGDTWALSWTSGVGVQDLPAPARFWLGPSYPNPAGREISIPFGMPQAGSVSLYIHDVAGRVVRILLKGPVPPGRHTVRWDRRTDRGTLTQAGVYICNLRAGGVHLSRRIVTLR